MQQLIRKSLKHFRKRVTNSHFIRITFMIL